MLSARHYTLLDVPDAEVLQDCLLRSLEYRLGNLEKRQMIIRERLSAARTGSLMPGALGALALVGAPFAFDSSTFWLCLVGGALSLRMALRSRSAWRGLEELLQRPELVGSAD